MLCWTLNKEWMREWMREKGLGCWALAAGLWGDWGLAFQGQTAAKSKYLDKKRPSDNREHMSRIRSKSLCSLYYGSNVFFSFLGGVRTSGSALCHYSRSLAPKRLSRLRSRRRAARTTECSLASICLTSRQEVVKRKRVAFESLSRKTANNNTHRTIEPSYQTKPRRPGIQATGR